MTFFSTKQKSLNETNFVEEVLEKTITNLKANNASEKQLGWAKILIKSEIDHFIKVISEFESEGKAEIMAFSIFEWKKALFLLYPKVSFQKMVDYHKRSVSVLFEDHAIRKAMYKYFKGVEIV